MKLMPQDNTPIKLPGLFLAILIQLALSGCTQVVSPTMSVRPTSNDRQVTSTALPVATRVPSVTPTPLPVVTYAPSLSPTVRLVAPTPITRPTPTEDATLMAAATAWAPFGNCYLGTTAQFISPNGTWALCTPVTVVDRAGRSYSLTYPGTSSVIHGEWFIGYSHWTADGQYLYLVPIRMGDGPGPRVDNGFMLVRISLQDSQLQEAIVVPSPGSSGLSSSFSISPTDRRLVYHDFFDPGRLIVEDLKSGAQTAVPIDAGQGDLGWFTWSPDGFALVYYLVESTGEGCQWRESIRWLDLRSLETLKVTDDVAVNRCNDPDAVEGDYDVLEVAQTSVRLERDGNLWLFDVATGQMQEQPRP